MIVNMYHLINHACFKSEKKIKFKNWLPRFSFIPIKKNPAIQIFQFFYLRWQPELLVG